MRECALSRLKNQNTMQTNQKENLNNGENDSGKFFGEFRDVPCWDWIFVGQRIVQGLLGL